MTRDGHIRELTFWADSCTIAFRSLGRAGLQRARRGPSPDDDGALVGFAWRYGMAWLEEKSCGAGGA